MCSRRRKKSVNSEELKKTSHDPSLQAANRSCELVISRAGYNFFQYKRVDYLSPLGRWGIYPISGRARKVPNYLTLVKGPYTCDVRQSEWNFKSLLLFRMHTDFTNPYCSFLLLETRLSSKLWMSHVVCSPSPLMNTLGIGWQRQSQQSLPPSPSWTIILLSGRNSVQMASSQTVNTHNYSYSIVFQNCHNTEQAFSSKQMLFQVSALL